MKKITCTDITAIFGLLLTAAMIFIFTFTANPEADVSASKSYRRFPVKFDIVTEKNSQTINKLLKRSIKNCSAK